MPKKDFVHPESYSILIPYSDFIKLVEMASKVDEMEKKYKHMEDMYVSIQEMWREALEKIADIQDLI